MGSPYDYTSYLSSIPDYGQMSTPVAQPAFSMGANYAMPQVDTGVNMHDYSVLDSLAQTNPALAGQITSAVNGAGAPASGGWGDWSKFIFGENGKGGAGNLLLGAANGIGSLYMGMQQYGLAKEAFDESKRQFGLNYNMQRKDLNRQLEDRQAARVASNSSAYQSVGDYMKKHGV